MTPPAWEIRCVAWEIPTLVWEMGDPVREMGPRHFHNETSNSIVEMGNPLWKSRHLVARRHGVGNGAKSHAAVWEMAASRRHCAPYGKWGIPCGKWDLVISIMELVNSIMEMPKSIMEMPNTLRNPIRAHGKWTISIMELVNSIMEMVGRSAAAAGAALKEAGHTLIYRTSGF